MVEELKQIYLIGKHFEFVGGSKNRLIYKSENKEIISAFEQFCKEIDVKLTKEIYLNNKSIIKKEIK